LALDSIDEIEAKNHRNLETAEMVSAYMRANAQRAAQKAAQQRVEPEAKPEDPYREAEGDKLDFSSEFSTGDMGLNSQDGSAAELLAWKRQIEEEEEERRRKGDDDEEQAEEWTSGAWKDKESDEDSADQERPDDQDPDQTEQDFENSDQTQIEDRSPAANEQSLQRPHSATPPSYTPPPFVPKPAAAPANAKPAELTAEAAEAFWGGESLGEGATAPDLLPRPVATASTPLAAPPLAYAQRLRPAPQVELPASGQLAQIDSNLAQLARNLISTPADQPGYEECVRLLARFEVGALRMCGREKVRVEILDEADFASHPALLALQLPAEEMPCDGAYLVARRLVLVDRRCLTSKPRFFHPALYYFAHAFDHAQGGETFSSRKAAAVVACFEASTRAYNGFDFVDELAAADPVRYFARSVAVYLGRDDCSDPLWSHQDLYDFDRPMYDYLQYLFARLGK
jgi:hypothetical protein